MITELNQFNNDITSLDKLDEYCYENIFKLYTVDDYYVFNILNKINIPFDLDESFFNLKKVDGQMSWPLISYKEYGTIKLWWLICIVNGIRNPVPLPIAGTVLRVIKPTYVRDILDEVKNQLAKR